MPSTLTISGSNRLVRGQGQVAVGDGGSKRPRGGRHGIDMYPLAVAGGIGEQVDALLVDGRPRAVAEMAPHRAQEIAGRGEHGRHGPRR